MDGWGVVKGTRRGRMKDFRATDLLKRYSLRNLAKKDGRSYSVCKRDQSGGNGQRYC